MEYCNICPRKCNVIRKQQTGFCKMGELPVVARAALHKWEEPCISGTKGSGTIFFSGCNLKCVFCQNFKISNENYGKQITVDNLRKLYFDLISQGAHNINLVNPTHFIEPIIQSLDRPLPVPIVYNSSGYENVSSIELLKNKIQIYLPDLKYADNTIAKKYSKVDNYFEITTNAIIEMYKQVGNYEFDTDGIIQKGVIIRHLVLPNNIKNTFKVIDWIKNNFKNGEIIFSLLNQYIPYGKAYLYPEINRKLFKREYKKVEQYLFDSGIEDGYIQELSSAKDNYIPPFNINELKF